MAIEAENKMYSDEIATSLVQIFKFTWCEQARCRLTAHHNFRNLSTLNRLWEIKSVHCSISFYLINWFLICSSHNDNKFLAILWTKLPDFRYRFNMLRYRGRTWFTRVVTFIIRMATFRSLRPTPIQIVFLARDSAFILPLEFGAAVAFFIIITSFVGSHHLTRSLGLYFIFFIILFSCMLGMFYYLHKKDRRHTQFRRHRFRILAIMGWNSHLVPSVRIPGSINV